MATARTAVINFQERALSPQTLFISFLIHNKENRYLPE